MALRAFHRLKMMSLSTLIACCLLSCKASQESSSPAGHVALADKQPKAMTVSAADPEPAVLVYQDVAPATAEAINARMPVNPGPLVAARPFRLTAGLADDRNLAAATDCLTAAIYYEAASEGEAGQMAVAQVVINRMRHPAFPKSICGVVFQGMERTTGCQFSFTCDGSLLRAPSPAGWLAARRIARQALAGRVDNSVGLATHYHTKWVVPYWRSDLTKLAVIGAHIFYRWTGGWGTANAYRGAYAANEVVPTTWANMRSAVLLSTSIAPNPDMDVATDAAKEDSRTGLAAHTGGELKAAVQKVALAADEPHASLLADERRGSLIRD